MATWFLLIIYLAFISLGLLDFCMKRPPASVKEMQQDSWGIKWLLPIQELHFFRRFLDCSHRKQACHLFPA
ncbi:hypothetical protein HNR77_001338 [Paenibacillus sp. JGP012]|nr:hypothetical protein [Paenibacillus sp. JGP012]